MKGKITICKRENYHSQHLLAKGKITIFKRENYHLQHLLPDTPHSPLNSRLPAPGLVDFSPVAITSICIQKMCKMAYRRVHLELYSSQVIAHTHFKM